MRCSHSIWSAKTFGERPLDRRREVQDDAAPALGLPDLHDRLAHLQGEVGLGLVEQLGGVLVGQVAVGQHPLGVAHHRPGALDGQVTHARPVQVEHGAAEQGGGRVVDVHDRAARALQGLHGAPDLVVTGLGEHGDRDVVRGSGRVR